jgi:hypothetical protein
MGVVAVNRLLDMVEKPSHHVAGFTRNELPSLAPLSYPDSRTIKDTGTTSSLGAPTLTLSEDRLLPRESSALAAAREIYRSTKGLPIISRRG